MSGGLTIAGCVGGSVVPLEGAAEGSWRDMFVHCLCFALENLPVLFPARSMRICFVPYVQWSSRWGCEGVGLG
jgi:hypothetical protein